MLPAHLQVSKRHDTDDDSPHNSHSRLETDNPHFALESPRSSQMCLTGVVCDSHTLCVPNRGHLHYTVFRPRHLRYKTPLVCCSGGPLLPCTYLSVLVHLITDRAIVFYNPLGVGQSKLCVNTPATDLQGMLVDLKALIQHLGIADYHLYGHSFGGILAYEYIQYARDSQCKSLILSNTPTSIEQTMADSQRLLDEIKSELGDTDSVDIGAMFSQRHECRVTPMPLPLQQSFQMAGFQSSRLGLSAVKDYAARESNETVYPPTCIINGKHDFVQSNNWGSILSHCQTHTLENCSHYGMLEDEDAYKRVLLDFVHGHDPPAKPIVLPNGVVINR
jgi:pimeloyl-ACP methyl ester carboxylesterase